MRKIQDIPKTQYLCDGKVENCKKDNCYQRGGECRHTSNIEHAINFKKPYKNSGFVEYGVEIRIKRIERMIAALAATNAAIITVVLILMIKDWIL